MTDIQPLRTNKKNNASAWHEGVSPETQVYSQELEDIFTFRTLCFPILFSTSTLRCVLFFHLLILLRRTWLDSALLRARIMQQNREDFQEWYDKSFLHLDIEKGHTYRGLIIHWHGSGTALTRYDKSIADRTEGCVRWHFFHIDIQTLISQSSRSAGWGANVKFTFYLTHLIFISILSPATTTIKHPRARHSLQNTLVVFTVRLNPQRCWFARRSWLWVTLRQLRRERKWEVYDGICLREGSHMEGI